jgi:hypothetical protein
VHTQKSRAGTDDKKLKLKRLTIDLTSQQHRVLKSLAAKAGMTMRELVLESLQKNGLLGRAKRRGRSSSINPDASEASFASKPSAEAIDD